MDKLTALYERALVVLRAAPTYITGLLLVVTTVGDEIPYLQSWTAQVAVWLVTAIAIIRRVTPVAKTERGLL